VAKRTRKTSDVDRLHLELFGSMPAKAGTAYERIAAIVMASLGWIDVVHDRTERPEGRLADHQLDVTCRNPDGSVRRLLIECKDWDTESVGQDELLKLSTVRDRIGASHAAIITKLDFTEGARAVAVDDDIALLRLRPYLAGTDDGTWIQKVTTEISMGFPAITDVELLTPEGMTPAQALGVRVEAWMGYLSQTGEEAGTLDELFAMGVAVGPQDGVTHKEARLEAPVQVQGTSGWILIEGLQWNERLLTDTTVVTVEAEGTPRLVLQQLNADGTPASGRVIVGEKLMAWEIRDDGSLVQRLRLP
jgi:hypothetical protein